MRFRNWSIQKIQSAPIQKLVDSSGDVDVPAKLQTVATGGVGWGGVGWGGWGDVDIHSFEVGLTFV